MWGKRGGASQLRLPRFSQCLAMAKHEKVWDPELVRTAMAAVIRAPPGDICVLDCRHFKPRHGEQKMVDHVGTNQVILDQVLRDPFCSTLLQYVARVLQDALREWVSTARRQSRRTVHIVMLCKSGKHRSVAMAWLLYRALQMGSAYALPESRPVCWTDLEAASQCTRQGRLCTACNWTTPGFMQFPVWLAATDIWDKAHGRRPATAFLNAMRT